MKAWKGLQPGQAISASEYSRLCKAVFEAYGTGDARVSIANGRLQIHAKAIPTQPNHPFKISAYLDDTAAPTVCLVQITEGTLTGIPSPDGTYLGFPIFEGSGGVQLDNDPIPEYDIGVTEGVTWFYFCVTTDNEGLIKTVWIQAVPEADIATDTVDVPYVQEDFPLIGDSGNDGTYFFPIGYAEIVIEGTAPNFITTVRTVNTLQSSAVFWTCGGAGIFGGIALA